MTQCQGVLEGFLELVISKLSYKRESDILYVNRCGGRIEGKHAQKNEDNFKELKLLWFGMNLVTTLAYRMGKRFL